MGVDLSDKELQRIADLANSIMDHAMGIVSPGDDISQGDLALASLACSAAAKRLESAAMDTVFFPADPRPSKEA